MPTSMDSLRARTITKLALELAEAKDRLDKIAKLLEWPDHPGGLGEAANKALEIARGERAP